MSDCWVTTAWEADVAGVTTEMTSHPVAPRAMAWRTRSAACKTG